MPVLRIAAFAMAVVFTASNVWAATPNCGNATDAYNSAISEVSAALERYASCLSNSSGNDDCSSEFSKLKTAQSDFESAVSKYESECN
jgi:hypothetical protein